MKVITIGRDQANDKVIMDPCTSRHHMQIVQHDDGHFSLSDFGSTNGTYVNGQKISGEIPLNDTDVVRIGNTTIPWRMYFEDLECIEGGVIESPIAENQVVEQKEEVDDGSIVKEVIGIIIGLVMVVGGLSGALVLRGTGSSVALVIVGAVILVFNILLLISSTKNNK